MAPNYGKDEAEAVSFIESAGYLVVRKLGSGVSSSVFEVVSGKYERLALKVMKNEQGMGEARHLERNILLYLDPHRNIISYAGVLSDSSHFGILMERCSISLRQVASFCLCNESFTAFVMKQALLAVQHCHRKGIVHRDLKLDHFLLALDNRTIKLVDFGLAAVLGPDERLNEPGIGTPLCRAPEVLLGFDYGFEVDAWSMGVMLFQLLLGCNPFRDERDVIEPEMFLPERFGLLSFRAQGLIAGLLRKFPSTRFTIDQALNHPWLTALEELAPAYEHTLPSLLTQLSATNLTIANDKSRRLEWTCKA